MTETYASDVAFLSRHTRIVELFGPGDARVAVAPGLQGRVMTSTVGGKSAGFGWLNAAFIESGRQDEHFNNYGGEDRFWLGPEAGQFGLWFAPGDPYDLAHWKTPRGFDAGRFPVTSQGKRSVAMAVAFDVTNRSGFTFHCAVKRLIRTLSGEQAAEHLGASVPPGVKMVGYESVNVLANVGDRPWTRDGGLLSVWILGQFKPLPRGKVIVPINPGDAKLLGPPATTDYFGPVPPSRCDVGERRVLFTCDGKCRGKIGISPARARNVLGSYDPDAKALTIVLFNLPGGAAGLPYVNSLWEQQARPFAGDVINSYNDGKNADGGQLGPFYEIETESPAAELAAGQGLTHVHRTFHFVGPKESLRDLARRTLGVDLEEIAD